tara:strand:+ start:11076 stop:12560 length:1485 start_codon:yes stop_codon:yes gene_type:complete
MSTDVLMEKWAPVINHDDLDPIKERDKKAVVAQVLENTEKALKEEAGVLDESMVSGAAFGGAFSGAGSNATINATGRAGYDPIIISLVRRAMPQMMAFDLCGVQPMSAPTGLIFALRARYGANNETEGGINAAEAFYNEVFPNFSGTAFNTGSPGTHAAGSNDADATNPFAPGRAHNDGAAASSESDGFGNSGTPVNDPFQDTVTNDPALNTNYNPSMAEGTSPYGMTTREGEGDNFREMSFTIERTAVEAKTRALKSEYTMELVQDLKAVHGLDAEAELSNILSTEILAEINREVVRTMVSQAKYGADGLTNDGIFDLIADGQGRWSVERQKGLMLQLEKEANKVAFETRRGKGNFVLCSANVASSLTMAGLLDYSSGLNDNLNVDVTSGVFAGTLNGRMKVYVDPYATSGDYAVVGYKGSNNMDAGMFYCPYVPLQMVRAVAQETFQPKIGFKTRYGMVSNPFAAGAGAIQSQGLVAPNTNVYYRKFRIDNV